MSETHSRDPILKRAHKFELAAGDMRDAAATAEWFVAARGLQASVDRVIATGIVVVYSRPFLDNEVGMVDRVKYAPKNRDLRRLHDLLIETSHESSRAHRREGTCGIRPVVLAGASRFAVTIRLSGSGSAVEASGGLDLEETGERRVFLGYRHESVDDLVRLDDDCVRGLADFGSVREEESVEKARHSPPPNSLGFRAERHGRAYYRPRSSAGLTALQSITKRWPGSISISHVSPATEMTTATVPAG
jgi:hypothetical protein